MEQVKATAFEIGDERVAWEGLAASCTPPMRRLGAFLLVGFVSFIATTTALVLLFNIFGERLIEGQGVFVPTEGFYATMAFGLVLGLGGYSSGS